MELRHLRTAITLAEELHFGRAAKRLHCVQSAVSVALKGLEGELGTALFVRSRRSVALTPAGEAFVAHARRALEAVTHAEAAARASARGEAGRLALRFTLMTALTHVPKAIAEFRRRYPNVDVQIGQGGSRTQLAALRAHEIDIAFVTLTPPLPGLAAMSVTEEPLLCLLPSRHPLARKASLTMDELRTEPRIMLSRFEEPHIFDAYSTYSRKHGIEPNIVLEVDQVESVLAFVAAGLGVAHAPASVRRLPMKGVVGIPMRPKIPSGITALWDDASLPVTGRNFLTLLKAAA